ncbi:MAG: DUF4214 domain-containing protein [Pseudomonadota bacterium]
MAFTIAYTDAAHKYGLDDPTNASGASTNALGGLASYSTSFDGNNVPIGVPISVTLNFSGGFTVTEVGAVTSFTGGVVTAILVTRTATGEVLSSVAGSIPVSSTDLSVITNPVLLYSGADTITGNAFNNTFRGFGGNDRIDGGAGTDTAVFGGSRASYNVTKTTTGYTVSGADGVDTLVNVERLKFTDKTIAYDTSGNAGEAYRLYQAALGRTPDSGGLGFQTRALDAGQSLHDVAQGFITSPEFAAKYGALNNTAFVTQLYANVLHRTPDQGGLAFHVNNLNTGVARADVLTAFSESPENQAALIGVIANGMTFDN